MRVLMAADTSIDNVIGGGERVLREQSTRLAQRGHSVCVLTRRIGTHETDRQYIDGVTEYRYAVDRRNAWRFISTTLNNASKRFAEILGKYSSPVVDCHQPFTAYAVLRNTASRKLRIVYTCHSLAHEEYISRNPAASRRIALASQWVNVLVRRHMEKQCLQRSNAIVVLSRYTKNKLIRSYRLPPEKISIIPGGVDTSRFRPGNDKQPLRFRIGIPENRFIILTVRNLVPRMGLSNLIAAFKEVHRVFPSAFLIIGGEGVLRTPLERQVAQAGLKEHVLFTGFIPEDDLADAYRMADLFVLPTVELEGFGMVTLEAMATGLPVLGTPVGGTYEILSQLDKRLLFRDSSPKSIAELIIKTCQIAAKKPNFLQDLSMRCHAFTRQHYDWNQNIQRLEAVLEGSLPCAVSAV